MGFQIATHIPQGALYQGVTFEVTQKVAGPMSWREIAWSGVRFSTPIAWEVAKIGPRYLLLADQEEPAMEIKWERVKGRFSHRTALRRLRSVHGKTVQESPLPDEWKQILVGFTGMGFTWQAETRGGRGAILFCPACGNATLIQFFRDFSSPSHKTCLRVLASFQDHNPDDKVLWSIFDIRAETPAEYRLVRYRFEAGRFEMHFDKRGQQITLYRWGPASALLDNGNIAAFAAKAMRIQQSEWCVLHRTGYNAVQWEKSVSGDLWTRCRERLMRVPHFQWLRLWHLTEQNRLMGIGAKGNKTFQAKFLDRICNAYESL